MARPVRSAQDLGNIGGQCLTGARLCGSLLINPNTSESITLGVADALTGFAPGLIVTPLTARFGPRYIGTRAGCVVAAHAVIDAIAATIDPAASPRFDGILLGVLRRSGAGGGA